jgi:hypothetical protein
MYGPLVALNENLSLAIDLRGLLVIRRACREARNAHQANHHAEGDSAASLEEDSKGAVAAGFVSHQHSRAARENHSLTNGDAEPDGSFTDSRSAEAPSAPVSDELTRRPSGQVRQNWFQPVLTDRDIQQPRARMEDASTN